MDSELEKRNNPYHNQVENNEMNLPINSADVPNTKDKNIDNLQNSLVLPNVSSLITDVSINNNTNTHGSSIIINNSSNPNPYLKDSIIQNNLLFNNIEDENEFIKALDIQVNFTKKRPMYMINPVCKPRWLWDLIIVILLLIQMLYVPLGVSFVYHFDENVYLALNIFLDLVFFLDIFVNFTTGLYDSQNNKVVYNLSMVTRKYINGWFLVDFISFLPIDYVYLIYRTTNPSLSNYIRLLRLTHMIKLSKILTLFRSLKIGKFFRYLTRLEEKIKMSSCHWRIFNLVIFFMVFSHWNCCLHYLLPLLMEFPKESWVVTAQIQNNSFFSLYGWSMLATMSEMMTTGYGKSNPGNVVEAWMSIISMAVGGTLVAILISVLFSVFLMVDSSGRLYDEKIQQVDEYMNYRRIPQDIRRNVHDYYEHRYERKLFDEEAILNELSPALKEEVLLFSRGQTLRQVRFLSKASDADLADLAMRMRIEVFLPGDLIYRAGSYTSKMYVVQNGTVDLKMPERGSETVHHRNTSCYHLKEGCWFGEINLLTGRDTRLYSAWTVTICDLLTITSEDLEDLLKMNDSLKEIFLKEEAWLKSLSQE